MALEFPTDLIRQAQAALRKEAGLPDYDPDNTTLPAIPSLASLVAGLHPSPPHLRCKNCKGRLLRGQESLICVHCGRLLRNEENAPPEPIYFKSTFGYQWFLHSLHLDGSEIVRQPNEGTNSNKGKSTPTKDIKLSDFLDLKITWPTQSEELETSLANNPLEESNIFLNFTGIDLNNFFSGPKKDTLFNASDGQTVIERKIETTECKPDADWDDLSFLQREQPSGTTAELSEKESADDFSGWQADFQSAGSESQHENPKPCDAFVGPTGDLSAHLDSVFGTGSGIDAKLKDESAPSHTLSSDLIENDLWNNYSSAVAHQTELSDTSVTIKDGPTPDSLNNTSSTSVDWSQDNQWQSNDKNASYNITINEDDDSFGEWNDFRSSATGQGLSEAWKQSSEPVATNGQSSQSNMFGSTDNFQELDFGSFSQADLFSGSHSIQTGSAEESDFFSEFHASDRSKVAEPAGEGAKNNDLFSTSTQTKDDLEMLMSQMHDLSFMLESKLSVPSKCDHPDASPQN